VNTIINIWVQQNGCNFLISWGAVRFPRTLLHGEGWQICVKQHFLNFQISKWIKVLCENNALTHRHFILLSYIRNSRSQCPRGLRGRSAAARLLRSWVRIPPWAWMSVCCECCVVSGRGLCDELITRPEESYRLWCVVVCDLQNLKNEEAMRLRVSSFVPPAKFLSSIPILFRSFLSSDRDVLPVQTNFSIICHTRWFCLCLSVTYA
jgi:hypothetical protein